MLIFYSDGHLGFHINRLFYFRPSIYVIKMKKSIHQLKICFHLLIWSNLVHLNPVNTVFQKLNTRKKICQCLSPHTHISLQLLYFLQISQTQFSPPIFRKNFPFILNGLSSTLKKAHSPPIIFAHFSKNTKI